MMLGTAASNSMAMPTGRFIHTGASSVRKMAMPKLTGIAITSAITEVITVPYTAASAPYWSVTGFHTSRVRKCSLKCASAGQAPCASDTATPPRSVSTRSAATNVAARNRRSRSRCPAACRGSMAAAVFIGSRLHPFGVGCAGHGWDTLDVRLPGRAHLLDQAVRQRHVVELGRHFGAVAISPIEELERLAGRSRIGRRAVEQDEARTGDRPAARTRLIRQDQVVPRRVRPVGVAGGGLE